MDFKLNIGTLTTTIAECEKLMEILSQQKSNVNKSISKLFDLGWSGCARDKFEIVHNEKQQQYVKLEEDVKYMKDALETEEKPKAVLLKKRCEAFIDCISHGGFSSESTSDDEGIISLDFSGPNYIKSIIDSCTLHCYNKMNLDFEAIESITKDLEYTSFNIGFDLFNCERFVNNQKLSLKDFDDSLFLYNQGINEMEQNICSKLGQISGISERISNIGSAPIVSKTGEVDIDKAKSLMVKNANELTDVDSQFLEYIKNIVGEDKYEAMIAEAKMTHTNIDINNYPDDVKKQLNGLFEQLDRIEEKHGLYDVTGLFKLMDYDEAMITTWDGIDKVIEYANSDLGKNVEGFKTRTRNVVSGTLQATGGFTESALGVDIGIGASWTGIGAVGGGYLAADGVSSMIAGSTKVASAIVGDNKGELYNPVKYGYTKISPKYGEDIYNFTEIGIGCFTIGKGIYELPSNATKIFTRPKNVARAEKEGLETSSVVMDVGKQVVVTRKTKDGMILQKTVIDKSKLKNGSLFIGIDGYNADSSIESIK